MYYVMSIHLSTDETTFFNGDHLDYNLMRWNGQNANRATSHTVYVPYFSCTFLCVCYFSCTLVYLIFVITLFLFYIYIIPQIYIMSPNAVKPVLLLAGKSDMLIHRTHHVVSVIYYCWSVVK